MSGNKEKDIHMMREMARKGIFESKLGLDEKGSHMAEYSR